MYVLSKIRLVMFDCEEKQIRFYRDLYIQLEEKRKCINFQAIHFSLQCRRLYFYTKQDIYG